MPPNGLTGICRISYWSRYIILSNSEQSRVKSQPERPIFRPSRPILRPYRLTFWPAKLTLSNNEKVILKVIERIAEHAPDTAVHLRALVQDFKIERIRELLADAG